MIELAADRTPFICQSQSLNLFLPADVDKWDLHMLHLTAWEKGVKSLYYCRSKSIQRADTISAKVVGQGDIMAAHVPSAQDAPGRLAVAVAVPQENGSNYEECLACQ